MCSFLFYGYPKYRSFFLPLYFYSRFFNQLRLARMHRIKEKRELSLLVSSSSLSFLASPANLIT